MTQFFELAFSEYNLHHDFIKKQPNTGNRCVCCLTQKVSFVNLATCKHSYILESLCNRKIEDISTLACYECHHILMKIHLFKKQVEESHIILNELNKQDKCKREVKKRKKLHLSNVEITSAVNFQPITFEIKSEPTNEEPEYDGTIEIKLENDSYSDMDTDLPLSEIKKEMYRSKKRKKPEKKIPPAAEKYEGKIRIVILSREELMAERDSERTKDTYLRLPFKCDSCITGFDHEPMLQDHIKKRHTEDRGTFTCSICRSVLTTEPSYKEHCKRHFRRYECTSCGKRNNTLHSVIKHYNEQHGTISTEFTCQDCGFVTQSHRSYRYHRDKHKAKQQCTECGNTFVNKTGLKVHMFTVHKQSSRVYSCEECNKIYNAKSGLLAHAAARHGAAAGAGAYCAPCRTHFRTENSLKHHLKTHSSHVSDLDKRFVCSECGAKFLTKASLQEHVDWVHLKNVKFECGKCSKVFKNSSALKKHKNFVHEKKRPPRNKICDHCGRGFTTLTILRSHIRTHTGERPLQCPHCPATFAHSAALYTHNRLLHVAARV